MGRRAKTGGSMKPKKRGKKGNKNVNRSAKGKVRQKKKCKNTDNRDAHDSSLEGCVLSRQETVYPSQALIESFARDIGLDPKLDVAHLWICREALDASLPKGWQLLKDPTKRYFFQNGDTRTYVHPRVEEYRQQLRTYKLKTYQKQGQGILKSGDNDVSPKERRKRQQKELNDSLEASLLFYRGMFGDPDVDCVDDFNPDDIPNFWVVTPQQVKLQVKMLQINVLEEPQMLWIARLAAVAPLPSGWTKIDDHAFICTAWAHQEDGFTHAESPGTPYFRDLLRSYREECASVADMQGDVGCVMEFKDQVSGRHRQFDFALDDFVDSPEGDVVESSADRGGVDGSDTDTDTDADADADTDSDSDAVHSGDAGVTSARSPTSAIHEAHEHVGHSRPSSQHDDDERHHGTIWAFAKALCDEYSGRPASREVDVGTQQALARSASPPSGSSLQSRRIGALPVSCVSAIVQQLCRQLSKAERQSKLTVAGNDKALATERAADRLQFLHPILVNDLPDGWSMSTSPGIAGQNGKVFFMRGAPWPSMAESCPTPSDRASSIQTHLMETTLQSREVYHGRTKTVNRKPVASAKVRSLQPRGPDVHARHVSATVRLSTPTQKLGGNAAASSPDPWWPNFATWEFPKTKIICSKWIRFLQKKLAERVAKRSSNYAADQARLLQRQQERRKAEHLSKMASRSTLSKAAELRFHTEAAESSAIERIGSWWDQNSLHASTAPLPSVQVSPIGSPTRGRASSLQEAIADARSEVMADDMGSGCYQHRATYAATAEQEGGVTYDFASHAATITSFRKPAPRPNQTLVGTDKHGASLHKLDQSGVLGPNREILSLTLEQYVQHRQHTQEKFAKLSPVDSEPLGALAEVGPLGGLTRFFYQ